MYKSRNYKLKNLTIVHQGLNNYLFFVETQFKFVGDPGGERVSLSSEEMLPSSFEVVTSTTDGLKIIKINNSNNS